MYATCQPSWSPLAFPPPSRENDTQMGQNGNIPQNWATHNSPFTRRRHMGTHPIPCGFMVPLRIALTLGQVAHATLGRTIRGRRGMWPFWAKRPKFTQKWSLEKSYLCITREIALGPLHACKRKLCFPFATRVVVQSVRETSLTPQSLKHTIYGKKCIYRRHWQAYIYGSLKSQNMSKHSLSRPIVSASKYAHYG